MGAVLVTWTVLGATIHVSVHVLLVTELLLTLLSP